MNCLDYGHDLLICHKGLILSHIGSLLVKLISYGYDKGAFATEVSKLDKICNSNTCL